MFCICLQMLLIAMQTFTFQLCTQIANLYIYIYIYYINSYDLLYLCFVIVDFVVRVYTTTYQTKFKKKRKNGREKREENNHVSFTISWTLQPSHRGVRSADPTLFIKYKFCFSRKNIMTPPNFIV